MAGYLLYPHNGLYRHAFSDSLINQLNFGDSSARYLDKLYAKDLCLNRGKPACVGEVNIVIAYCGSCYVYTALKNMFFLDNKPRCIHCSHVLWPDPFESCIHVIWKLDPISAINSLVADFGWFLLFKENKLRKISL